MKPLPFFLPLFAGATLPLFIVGSVNLRASDPYYRALMESREKAASDRAFDRYIYGDIGRSTNSSAPARAPVNGYRDYSSDLAALNAQSKLQAQWAEEEANSRRMRARQEARDAAAQAREAESRALNALYDAAEAGDANSLMTLGQRGENSAFGSWGLPHYQMVFGPRRSEALWKMIAIIRAHPGEEALRSFRNESMILRELASRGDATAARQLADLQLRDGDYFEASSYFTQAGAAGDLSARRAAIRLVAADQVDLLPLAPEVFSAWCREAAQQGDISAQLVYGKALSSGLETKKDPAEAMRWLRLAMAQPESKLDAAQQRMRWLAQERVGLMLLEGADGVPANPAEGAQLLEALGKQSYPPALRQLGLAYLSGRGVEQDREVGLRWLHRAADEGDAPAMEELAVTYLVAGASGTEATEGLRWLLKVSKRGPRAMLRYGQILFDGEYGIPRDPEAAVEFFGMALEHYPTDPQVLDFIGWSYLKGYYGLAEKPSEGVRALKLAVEQGNRVSARRLEQIYREGAGVTADAAEALRWKQRAEAME